MIVGLPEEAQPDFTHVIEMVREYAKSVVDGDHHDDGDEQAYIFEAAVEAVYGKKAFEHLNKFLR